MDFRYFFTGKMSREEAASAFLAMALDGSAGFRAHFFSVAGLAHLNPNAGWIIDVEDERVDVTLRSNENVVLVENKIESEALRAGQLLSSYEAEAGKSIACVSAVLLSPNRVGVKHVEAVRSCESFLKRAVTDRVLALSWHSLIDYRPGDDEEWIASGLHAIEEAIERANAALYPAIGSRAILRRLVDQVGSTLKGGAAPSVMRWSAKDKEVIVVRQLPVTTNVWLQFTYAETESAPVLDAPDESGAWSLTLHTTVKPRGDLGASSPVRQWWRERVTHQDLVLGSRRLVPVQRGWMGHIEPVCGDVDHLRARMIGLAREMIEGVSALLPYAAR
jgi:hypothetical protein